MDALLLSFGVIFVAELGDKSQLMALAFAARYKALPVLAGITIATAMIETPMKVGPLSCFVQRTSPVRASTPRRRPPSSTTGNSCCVVRIRQSTASSTRPALIFATASSDRLARTMRSPGPTRRSFSRMLAKMPYLCQRCHLNTRHPGTLYDLRNTQLGANPSNRVVEHACRNCHQNVHGSNHPSAPYLGR